MEKSKMTYFSHAVMTLMTVLSFLHLAQAQQQPNSVAHSFFLIGDAGEPQISESEIGKVVAVQMQTITAPSTVLFLGDNIYPSGLSANGTISFERDQKILQTQVDWVKDLSAKAVFLPGNHDWQHWGSHGVEYVIRQQQWIDSLKDENIMFFPKEGCAGPVELVLNDDLVLVVLDTQWFLHQFNKGDEDVCEFNTTQAVMTALNDIFQRHYDKRILVAGHHPLITYGSHGGVFSFKDHVFPLAEFKKNLYIPLPVIGSFVPLYRKLFGHIQDNVHPVYKEFSIPLQALLEEYPGSFYVAGHEHALQHSVKENVHYVVSGAGVKTTRSKVKGYAKFAEGKKGFARLDILASGECELRFFQVDEQHKEGKEIYFTSIPSLQDQGASVDTTFQELRDSTVKVSASGQYQSTPLGEKLLGKNYRREWAQLLDVPVFDIGKERGGLKILQQGGGQQTLSLRLEDSTGREYVIRSVEKYPEKAVPEIFRKTFAQDLVQDQISASHPYAALVVPDLAEAVGVYHTNPKLYYVPDDRRLKAYRKLFANTLVLFEERPAGNWSDEPSFGNSKKIVNTTKVLEKTSEDNDNKVDEAFVVKSRLFDFVIGDWDRHDDQWRWATLPDKKKGDIFRPIPRDRDQAFFVNEGKLSKIWSRKWALPKFEGFDEKMDWPSGFSFNARFFDRTFLSGLSKEQWIDAAKQIQNDLTDEVIESSIQKWPKEIFELRGARIIQTLKKRRDRLIEDALSHYLFLAREVDIVGSDKREKVIVERMQNGETRVTMFKITKEGEVGKQLYDRLFHKRETKEIRVYALKGDDQFVINGKGRRAIRLRIIGGDGKDVVTDSSQILSGKPTLLYDQRGSVIVSSWKEVRDKTSTEAQVNEYDRKSFQYNRLAPLVYGNFNPDDGLFIGGGFMKVVQGFRKSPFKQRHIFLASVAPLTLSFNFRYQGKFTEVIGKWNVEVDADLRSPNYVNNFFGFGNETRFDSDLDDRAEYDVDESIDYYRYRFEELRLEPSVSRTFKKLTVRLGPSLQRIEMEENDSGEDRYIEDYASTLDYTLFSGYKSFLGGVWSVVIDGRNNPKFTRRGMHLNVTGRSMTGVNKGNSTFSSYEGSLAFYHSFSSTSRVTFALRTGAGVNTGDFEFYQAQILDGRTELRGYRKTRFYGDHKFYTNFEARLKLLDFKSYLFPASMGIVGFHDLGRVWYKDSSGNDPSTVSGSSGRWHRGVGGGVWFTPFSMAVLSTEFAHSRDGNMIYLRLGFLF